MKTILNNMIKATAAIFAVAIFSSTVYADKINLNKADAETIQYIPGIGPDKAEKIVETREKNGKLTSMDQIDAIKGFGERTMIDVIKHGSLDSGVSKLTPEMEKNRPSRTLSKLKAGKQDNAS